MPYRAVDLSRVRTYPLPRRPNRVGLEDLVLPSSPYTPLDNPELGEVADRVTKARLAGRPVICMIGGHVVKRGLAPLLADLMARGAVTHLASNGAATIHDFEIALQGYTSEDVARSLEDGSFGMAEETGSFMNQAIRQGAVQGLGLGEALGRWIAEDARFAYREHSLLYNAYRLGVPYTVHVAIGTDIIHQHPLVDFAALGWASGQDFKVFTASVCDLEGGVFLNFGSAVVGPEVFLKAVSIARNLDNPLRVFTTANFDLLGLEGDYRQTIGEDNPEYYYRPRKNIVIRPVLLGGRGYHIQGDHRDTLPTLYHHVAPALDEAHFTPLFGQNAVQPDQDVTGAPGVILANAITRYPELQDCRASILAAFRAIRRCFASGGTLFTAGNGGSMADAIHITGELDKSFKLPRSIPEAHRQRLSQQPDGAETAASLQRGLRTLTLGLNPALSSAIDNDFARAHMALAQELYVLARSGDVLLAISTSGNAANVHSAASVALAQGLTLIALTGQDGGRLAKRAHVAIRAPASDTAGAQNYHILIYHALCEMLEAEFFAPGGG